MPVERPVDHRGVPDVADQQFDAVRHGRHDAGRMDGGQQRVEDADVVAGVPAGLDDVRADEPRARR